MNNILLQLQKFKQTHNNLTVAETTFSRAKYEKIAKRNQENQLQHIRNIERN